MGILNWGLYSKTSKLLTIVMFPTSINYVLAYHRASAISIANSMVGTIVFFLGEHISAEFQVNGRDSIFFRKLSTWEPWEWTHWREDFAGMTSEANLDSHWNQRCADGGGRAAVH